VKKKITIGILAHVDAGKTTLSEALLFISGRIRTLGRVDHRNTYLDTNAIERERGITIFSKQARFSSENCDFILLDTPGHVDLSAETERTPALQVPLPKRTNHKDDRQVFLTAEDAQKMLDAFKSEKIGPSVYVIL